MKKLQLFILFLLLIAAGTISCQKKSIPSKVVVDTIATDSIEYELLVYDVGFDSWLATRPSMNYYSQSFYEMKNRNYVIAWNQRADNPRRYRGDYDMRIDYDPFIDYGLELNYKLYNYFLYFEDKHKVKLLNTSR